MKRPDIVAVTLTVIGAAVLLAALGMVLFWLIGWIGVVLLAGGTCTSLGLGVDWERWL